MSTAMVVLLVVGGAALVLACVLFLWPDRPLAADRVELRSRTIVELQPGPPRVLLSVDAEQLSTLYRGSLPDVPELELAIDESIRATGKAKGDAVGLSAETEYEDNRTVHRQLAAEEKDLGRQSRAFEYFSGSKLIALDLRPDDSYEDYRQRVRRSLIDSGRDVDALVDNAMERAWRSDRDTRNTAERISVRRLVGIVKVAARWTVESVPSAADPDRELVLRITIDDPEGTWRITSTARGQEVPVRWHGRVKAGDRITVAVVGVVMDSTVIGQRDITSFYCHFD